MDLSALRDCRRLPPRHAGYGERRRDLEATRTWIFDLDNTLYPAACDLFAQVDRRMGKFIARRLGLSHDDAHHLRQAYYREFGTTLAGLMRVHGVAPQPFLDYVHDIDLSGVVEDRALSRALGALPGRRLIFTNGSRGHAERVAARLGVLHHFEDICDIAACGYEPKPSARAFDRMVGRYAIACDAAAMFEDMARNLEVPHALGMTTVLVEARDAGEEALSVPTGGHEAAPHIHFRTRDLGGFLGALPETGAAAQPLANEVAVRKLSSVVLSGGCGVNTL